MKYLNDVKNTDVFIGMTDLRADQFSTAIKTSNSFYPEVRYVWKFTETIVR